jgi:hypothetical protein
VARYQPVTYADWTTIIGSIVAANLEITDQFGNPITPNFRVGGVLYTLEQIFALCFDAIENRLALVDTAHRISTAVGDDLDEFGLLMSKPRTGNTQARVPIKYVRNGGTGPAVTIPTDDTLLARDSTGQDTIQLTTAQDPSQPDGVSAILPVNGASVWGWATAVNPGVAGNIGAGTVDVLTGTIPGIDQVGNPPILDANVPAPTATVVGTPGTQSLLYAIVVNGMTGRTLTGPTASMTTAPNAMSGINYVHLTWASVIDAVSYDVLKRPVASLTWTLLGNVTTTALDDQGQATQAYLVPASNTTNQGIGGLNKEDDTPYRARIPLALSETASSTASAIVGAVEDLSGVRSAFLHDPVAGGSSPKPGTLTVQVVAASSPIPTGVGTLGDEIDQAIAKTKAAGIYVTWSELLPIQLTISYTLTVQSGSAATIGAALGDVNAAILAYFNTLSPGDTARISHILQAMLNALESNDTVIAGGADAAVTACAITDGVTIWTMQDVPAPSSTSLLGTTSGSITAGIVGG